MAGPGAGENLHNIGSGQLQQGQLRGRGGREVMALLFLHIRPLSCELTSYLNKYT